MFPAYRNNIFEKGVDLRVLAAFLLNLDPTLHGFTYVVCR